MQNNETTGNEPTGSTLSHRSWRILLSLILLVVVTHVFYLVVYVILPENIKHIPLSRKCRKENETFSEKLILKNDGNLLEGNLDYPPGYWAEDSGYKGCPCYYKHLKTCVRKCCPSDERFVSNEDLTCTKASPSSSSDQLNNTHLQALATDYFKRNIYVLDDHGCNEKSPFDFGFTFKTLNNETILNKDGTITLSETSMYIDLTGYCLESSVKDEGVLTVRCADKDFVYATYHEVRSIGYFLYFLKFVSVMCLLIALAVFISIPQLQTLHIKLLMCHTFSLAFDYISIAVVEIDENFGSFCTQIFFVARTAWLTAACFELWWIFNHPLTYCKPTKKVERRLFFLYSLFGWGLAILSALLTAAVGVVPERSDSCPKPRFPDDPCFFTVKRTYLLFITFPIYLMLSMDTVMFFFTLCNIKHHFNVMRSLPTTKLRQSTRERFWLYIRLCLMMGVNWFVNEIAFIEKLNILSVRWIFYLVVIYNLSQGIILFLIIVVWNKKAYYLVMEKWFNKKDMINYSE